MQKIAKINNRNIYFEEYQISKNWISEFPTKNWSLIIIADEENRNYFNEIITKAIDNNVTYIHCVGKQHDLIHDIADEELTFREIDIEVEHSPENLIITTGQEEFENGIWFGIYATISDEKDIDKVIILDVDNNTREKTFELLKKIKLGYVPND